MTFAILLLVIVAAMGCSRDDDWLTRTKLNIKTAKELKRKHGFENNPNVHVLDEHGHRII